MRFFIYAALLLLMPLAAHAQSLTGIYETSFESGFITPEDTNESCKAPLKMFGDICAEPFTATNTLGIFEKKNKDIDFAAELLFFNGHTCTISGTAIKTGNNWVFESVNLDKARCRLTIAVKDDALNLDVPDGYDCNEYCGARGNLSGATFPLSSKTDGVISNKDDLECIYSSDKPCNQSAKTKAVK